MTAATTTEQIAGRPKHWITHPRTARVGVALGLAAAASFMTWLKFYHPFVRTDDARVAATLVRVAPEGVGGKITRLNVKEGDEVAAGQIVLELDHSVAEANLLKSKAKAMLSGNELARTQRLAFEHGASQRDVDVAKSNDDTAQAELQLAKIALERTYVKSPTSGVVVQRSTELGNILEPNQVALTIADTKHPWVAANIEETAVGAVKIGQPVSIRVDEGGELTGKVSEVRAATASQFALIQAENPAGNFTKLVQRIPIKIEIDHGETAKLRAGQSVEIKIRVR